MVIDDFILYFLAHYFMLTMPHKGKKCKQKLKHFVTTSASCALDGHLPSLLLIILPTCQLSDAWTQAERGEEGMAAGILPLSLKNQFNSSQYHSQSVQLELGMKCFQSAQK